MARRLNALLVEDSEADAELIAYELRHAGFDVHYERVDDLASFAAALERPWDIVLCDHALPGFGSVDAHRLLSERGADVPFVIVSGLIGEEAAVAALKLGARDVVLKTNLARLGPVVERELAEAENRRRQREAERALAESEERFRRLAENAPDVIYRLQLAPTRKFEYVSQAITTMLGVTPEQCYADPDAVLSLVHPDDREALRDRLTEPNDAPSHLRWLTPHRGLVWTEAISAAIRDDDGNLIALEGVARDITARKRAEEEHASLEAQLRQSQRMEAVGRLAGGIAHDFNNLLTVVMGSSELILGQLAPNDPLRPVMEEIRLAGSRATSLTSQLLAFSRQHHVVMSAVDLNEIVKGMEEMLGRLIGEDVELTTKLAPHLGTVSADARQLEQVIMNLVVNARDAMPGGGALGLETSRAELDASSGFRDLAPGPYVVLSVADTGIGMDEETRSHAFEPFFTTKEPGKGTGLGLATVYGIVQRFEGDVWASSTPGSGTTFHVYLPETQVEATPHEPTTSERDRQGGGETILLIEDEGAVRRLVQRILESGGYQVLAAADGHEALDICASDDTPIDLVLTDVVLPGMDGIEIARRLRSLRPTVRTLFMSGYADRVVTTQDELGESVGFLEKPFDSGTLMTRIREALDEESPLASRRS